MCNEHMQFCIPVSQMHLQACFEPEVDLAVCQSSLMSSPSQVCSDQGTKGRKEDARDLISFSAILKGITEDYFVLTLIPQGSH